MTPIEDTAMDREDVRQVAHLARIYLTESELDRLTTQLDEILTSFEKLSELDTEGVEPMIYAVELKNVFRHVDDHRELTREEALANARDSDGTYFRVPRTFAERGKDAPSSPDDENSAREENPWS